MVKTSFYNTATKTCNTPSIIDGCWKVIERNYQSDNRHYHSFTHVEYMLDILLKIRHEFPDFDAVVFATIYHDIIYDAQSSNNEVNSSTIADEHLTLLQVKSETIKITSDMIIATKHHNKTNKKAIDLFLDADMAILGSNWYTFEAYNKQVRDEYSMYSDEDFNHGRKHFIQSLLQRESIFISEYFQSQFEKQAQSNCKRLLNCL